MKTITVELPEAGSLSDHHADSERVWYFGQNGEFTLDSYDNSLHDTEGNCWGADELRSMALAALAAADAKEPTDSVQLCTHCGRTLRCCFGSPCGPALKRQGLDIRPDQTPSYRLGGKMTKPKPDHTFKRGIHLRKHRDVCWLCLRPRSEHEPRAGSHHLTGGQDET
jgi:hypothetical protein